MFLLINISRHQKKRTLVAKVSPNQCTSILRFGVRLWAVTDAHTFAKKKNFFNPREIKTAISGEKPICALPVSEVSGLITSLNIHYNLAYVFLFLFNLWLIIHRCNVVEIAEYETYV